MSSKREIDSIIKCISLNPDNEILFQIKHHDNKKLSVIFGKIYLLEISAHDYPRQAAKSWISTKGKTKFITSWPRSMLSSITHQFMLVMFAYCVQSRISFPHFIIELDPYFARTLRDTERSPTYQWPLAL
nr:hypothetical transcript [Hymenolepis microstoma]